MHSRIISYMICILMFTSFFSLSVSRDANVQFTEQWETRNDSQENSDDLVETLAIGSIGDVYVNGVSQGRTTISPADSPWPMFSCNAQRTGLSLYNTSGNDGQLKWKLTTGFYIQSSPIIDFEDTIYIHDNNDVLHAINLNGTEKWNNSFSGITRTPAIDSHGTIYIGSYDNIFYAIDPNGTEKWNFTTGEPVKTSPAIASDDTIYFGTSDIPILFALNPDGTEKWRFIAGLYGQTSSPGIGPDGTIYVGSSDYNLYAINPDGTEKWRFTGASSNVQSAPAIDTNGTIYVGSHDHNLYAINPDGTEKWRFATGDSIGWSTSAAIGPDGTIYINSDDKNLYAINPDGTEKWRLTSSGGYNTPSIGSEGTIYVGSNDYNLYAINPDGTEKWNFTTDWMIHSSPAIGSKGTIYVGSWDKNLYAIGTLNIPPIANAGTNQIMNEGDTVQFDASSSYDPDGTIESYEWDFDSSDGLWWETGATPDAIGSTPSHIYGDNGVYTITLRVTDDANETDTDECIVTVNNVVPAITPFGPFTVNEGSQLNVQGTVTDPGSDDLTFTWDWGDGSSTVINIYYNNGIWPEPVYDPATNEIKSPWGTYPFLITEMVTHNYGDDGIYSVLLTIEDDDGGVTFYETTVTVNNVTPTITLMITYPDDEGSLVTFEAESTDPGSDDVTYSWELEFGPTIVNTYYNDGVGPEPVYDPANNEVKSPMGMFPFHTSDVETYVYGDNYDYTIILTVADDDGGESTATTTVTVDNLAPSIMEINIPSDVDEGSPAAFKVLSADQGSDDLTFTWEFNLGPTITNVHYNDGIGLDPFPSPWGNYPFDVWDIVYHTYGDDGVYGIELTIEDDDGGITTYSTDINVRNVAPTIDTATAPGGDEGAVLSYLSTATDPGSDDLTFTWNWGDGTLDTMNIHYNDGVGPDPPQSPMGTYPFTATDTVSHIYGDDGDYTVTLTVGDDDGGLATYTTTVTIDNVAPTIEPFGPFTVDEGSLLELFTTSTDPGSDDLIFTWEFELGPTITNIYYNDGLGPDPYPSPWGTFPFTVADTVYHTYGDNGMYMLMLTVEDDDGGVDVFTTNVTVNNVAPAIVDLEAYMYLNFSLRVAGEKWHSVGIHIVEDGEELSSAVVTRYPGNPDEQTGSISGLKIDMTKNYIILVDYLPNDPRVNGNVWGGNPVWIDITFENETVKRLHHTFNVRQSYWNSDHWNHIDPWEVDLNTNLIGCAFEITSHITDPGSDDILLTYTCGSQIVNVTYLNNPPNPDPYPSPEVNPVDIYDTTFLTYEGPGTISLTVTDDDGGICVIVLLIG